MNRYLNILRLSPFLSIYMLLLSAAAVTKTPLYAEQALECPSDGNGTLYLVGKAIVKHKFSAPTKGIEGKFEAWVKNEEWYNSSTNLWESITPPDPIKKTIASVYNGMAIGFDWDLKDIPAGCYKFIISAKLTVNLYAYDGVLSGKDKELGPDLVPGTTLSQVFNIDLNTWTNFENVKPSQGE